MTDDDVTARSPLLAGKKALNTAVMPLADVVDALVKVVRPADAARSGSHPAETGNVGVLDVDPL